MTALVVSPNRPVRDACRWRQQLTLARALRWLLAWLGLLSFGSGARADELPEYELKAAFLYNFALYTEWPPEVGGTLNLCIHGQDPFAGDIEELNGKSAGVRSIVVHRKVAIESLGRCQLVFIAASAMPGLQRVLDALQGQPVLTLADSPGAGRQGVIINMTVTNSKITFKANLRAARAARINLSSKLLRLATEVYQ
jgi:hypothetical protein